jgi:HSP20 family protein
MRLLKYEPMEMDPFRSLEHFFEPFRRSLREGWLEGLGTETVPLDVEETDEAYEVRAELPGFTREEIQVELENAVLEIHAKKTEGADTDTKKVLREQTRRLTVGEEVDADRVQARLSDGILTVTLPKSEHRKPRAITVS